MASATFSDRYATANTAITIPAAGTGYMPGTLGISGSGTGTSLRVNFKITPQTGGAADLYVLGPLLLGYTLTGFWMDFPAQDSSTGLQLELGDWTTAGKYIATGGVIGSSTAGRSIVSSYAGVNIITLAGTPAIGTTILVANSIPNFYSAYNATGQRSQPGASNSADFVNGVANDLLFTVTQAKSGTFTGAAVTGFYELTQVPYPFGTNSTNY